MCELARRHWRGCDCINGHLLEAEKVGMWEDVGSFVDFK